MGSAMFVTLSALAIFCGCVLTQPVKYDQRQEGDLNVRTDVEDVVFVVVPPQDLITAGMGLVAATAADFLRKNYGPIGPERWPMRTSPKLGFVPLEKSPYKVDLEKSGIKVKKISQPGDPNRYNFHDGKNPVKAAEVKSPMTTETPEKLTMEMMTEAAIDEMQSTTENKTVKKVLKPEEIKKVAGAAAEEMKKPTEDGMKKPAAAVNEKKQTMIEEMKKQTPMEDKKTVDDKKISTEPMKKIGEVESKTEEKTTEGGLKVMADGMDPSSIFRLEDCGPDAQRDASGVCVFKGVVNAPK